MSLPDELSQLETLHRNGVLSAEEFSRAKARLLNESSAAAPSGLVETLNRLRRSRTDRWLGGVCGGLARHSGAESWIWRLLLVAFSLLGGTGVVLYVLLWIFVPSE